MDDDDFSLKNKYIQAQHLERKLEYTRKHTAEVAMRVA